MGIFSFLTDAFAEGFYESEGQRRDAGRKGVEAYAATHTRDLLYPEELPGFAEIAKAGHGDVRALTYAMRVLHPDSGRPFFDSELSYLDFGRKSAAYTALRKCGMLQPVAPGEEAAELFTREELAVLAHERGLPERGKKRVLADRLIADGFQIDRNKRRGNLFRLTEKGAGAIAAHDADRRRAIVRAIAALKELNYPGAVAAYREFDRKWGFAHTSGKVHTIFAYYDIPYSHFRFVENCAMRELKNTEDFKAALRACLLAGLMRGCQDKRELTADFKSVCTEKLNCPKLLKLFSYDRVVLEEMQRQMDFNADNAMEYYISHLLYLSRGTIRPRETE